MSTTEEVKVGCNPCALGHWGTEVTLLNEAVRFKKDGLSSPQVIDDIGYAIGELNALERIDLTPEKIEALQDWEKPLAELAVEKSRETRHKLETVSSMDELAEIAAESSRFYKQMNRDWASKRISQCQLQHMDSESEAEEEPEEPKSEHYEYGASVSKARNELLEEIRRARGA